MKNFKIRNLWSMLLLAIILITTSCSKEEKGNEGFPAIFEFKTEITEGKPIFLAPATEYKLEYASSSVKSMELVNIPEGWEAKIDKDANAIIVKASESAVQKAKIGIKIEGEDNNVQTKEVEFYCLNSFTDPKGTFVLNEGNMTTENGSLTYITPEGYVLANAYKFINGSELGNVAQDMAFCNGKIYIISQNGDTNAVGNSFENDGMLIIADAKTLKKIKSYKKEELSVLDWPSHIAVLDEHNVFIRDNAGVYRLNTETNELTLINGTEGAPKSKFVTMNGKVYTYKTGLIGGIIEISADNDNANKINFPYRLDIDINEVLGIQAAEDGDMWIMSFGFGKTAIGKFNLTDRKITQRQINIKPSVGSAGVAFAAKGNVFYYADGTSIYRMTFDANPELSAESGLEAEEMLVDLSSLDSKAGIIYNGLGINPTTNLVYINTIKSYAQFQENLIWAFNFDANKNEPVAKYENSTSFPAGFFFSPNK